MFSQNIGRKHCFIFSKKKTAVGNETHVNCVQEVVDGREVALSSLLEPQLEVVKPFSDFLSELIPQLVCHLSYKIDL